MGEAPPLVLVGLFLWAWGNGFLQRLKPPLVAGIFVGAEAPTP
jgi:hypothetical protein